MGEKLGNEIQTGLNPEQILALSSLRVSIRPSVWRFWRGAMPDGPELVDVAVASVDIDKNGTPVAFGVRRSEMIRTIEEHGDTSLAEAKLVAIEPERILKFTADGSDLWPRLDYQNPPEPLHLEGDPYDIAPF